MSEQEKKPNQEKVLGSKKMEDWIEDEDGVLKLKEEIRQAQLGEINKNEKIEELRKEIKEEEIPQEPNEPERENQEEEKIEEKIQRARSFEDLISALKPMEKGRGITLYPKGPGGPRWNLGWFGGGKFGGEPVSDVLFWLDNLNDWIVKKPPVLRENSNYQEYRFVQDNLKYMPEMAGLKKRTEEFLEAWRIQNEIDILKEKIGKEEREFEDREKSQEVMELFRDLGRFLDQFKDQYEVVRSLEWVVNAASHEKEVLVSEFGFETDQLAMKALVQAEQKYEKIKDKLEGLLVQLEKRGLGVFIGNVRSVIENLKIK